MIKEKNWYALKLMLFFCAPCRFFWGDSRSGILNYCKRVQHSFYSYLLRLKRKYILKDNLHQTRQTRIHRHCGYDIAIVRIHMAKNGYVMFQHCLSMWNTIFFMSFDVCACACVCRLKLFWHCSNVKKVDIVCCFGIIPAKSIFA